MKRSVFFLLLGLVFARAIVVAHEGMVHIMGTVTEIGADSISVKSTKSAMVTVTVNADTQFKKDDVPAKFGDLKVGDRVVIHAKENNKKLVAVVVMFGKPSVAKKE